MTSERLARSSHWWPPVSHTPETADSDSDYMIWVKGKLYDHAGDHRNQQNVPLGAVGDLLAVTHAHEPTAFSSDGVGPVASAV